MESKKRFILLAFVAIAIIAAILYLESLKPERVDPGRAEIVIETQESSEEVQTLITQKEAQYERAKEIVDPDGFINTDGVAISELIGKQVILVDFWTYSCINCQRTTPYLNAWHEKYGNQGLTILGIHTPEFEFEKDYANVQRAVEKFQIKYPVIQDNEYKTWRVYRNRYWPRKYLIDIDGFIVYDHIGEGAYEETEKKIQELLAERAQRLNVAMTQTMPELEKEEGKSLAPHSPEVYFGAARNELFANGTKGQPGLQTLTEPDAILMDQLYLVGDWNIREEYAEAASAGAKIIYRYRANDVFMVASAADETNISVFRDGEPLQKNIGSDLTFSEGKTSGVVRLDQLYRLVEGDENETHTLEIIIEEPGLKAFTFTFG